MLNAHHGMRTLLTVILVLLVQAPDSGCSSFKLLKSIEAAPWTTPEPLRTCMAHIPATAGFARVLPNVPSLRQQ
jgi:hypothetical protein